MALRAVGTTLTVVAVSIAVWAAGRVTAQQAPGTPSGEWRSYAGDLRHQHYSPLRPDQRRQLQQARSRLAVQDRQPRDLVPNTSSRARRSW